VFIEPRCSHRAFRLSRIELEFRLLVDSQNHDFRQFARHKSKLGQHLDLVDTIWRFAFTCAPENPEFSRVERARWSTRDGKSGFPVNQNLAAHLERFAMLELAVPQT
jgi:hypothetical protein